MALVGLLSPFSYDAVPIFLYLVTLVLLSVQRFVCSRITLHILEVYSLASRVQNGIADNVLIMKSYRTCRTGERVQPLSRTANPRF